MTMAKKKVNTNSIKLSMIKSIIIMYLVFLILYYCKHDLSMPNVILTGTIGGIFLLEIIMLLAYLNLFYSDDDKEPKSVNHE